MRFSGKKFSKKGYYVLPVGKTVVSESYVYPLGYFLALGFELFLYLSVFQYKETQANTKHKQSLIKRSLKQKQFLTKKISNLIWIGSVFEEKVFRITA